MLSSNEARALFDGLMELISDASLDGRLQAVINEIRDVTDQGKPAPTEIRARDRRREQARSVVPLTDHERLEQLVQAIELALVTPVDLIDEVFSVLNDDEEAALGVRFERDPITALGSAEDGPGAETSSTSEPVSITVGDVRAALDSVASLRRALEAVKMELRS